MFHVENSEQIEFYGEKPEVMEIGPFVVRYELGDLNDDVVGLEKTKTSGITRFWMTIKRCVIKITRHLLMSRICLVESVNMIHM